MNKKLNKVLVGGGIVLMVVIFTLVFLKQIRVNEQGIAEVVKNDIENMASSPIGIRKSPDTTAQLQHDLDAVKLDELETGSKDIETQVNGM
ncbi:MAG: hypothetical protein ACM3KM_01195 [Acidobacteriaceae bacterium]